MEVQTNASYQFSDRLKGESKLELFNDHYLKMQSERLKKQREFKMEVATLNPAAKKVEERAWHWLVAGVVALCAAGYFIYYLITAAQSDEVWTVAGAIGLLLLLTAAFAFAYLLTSERKWVFETRAARYPLVTVPYDKASQKQAAAFVEQLQQAINTNTDKKGYSEDDLFAGEMRMLRRLAKAGIISDNVYDSAKKHMLTKNKKMHPAG